MCTLQQRLTKERGDINGHSIGIVRSRTGQLRKVIPDQPANLKIMI